jgi:hypothetical protein
MEENGDDLYIKSLDELRSEGFNLARKVEKEIIINIKR